MLDLNEIQTRVNNQNTSTKTARDLTDTIRALLKDQQVWSNIVGRNSTGGSNPGGSMDCLKNQTTCAAFQGVDTPFKIYIGSNPNPEYQNFTTGAAGQPGFTIDGTACNTFNDSVTGDASCVFGLKLTWRVLGTCTGACINPPLHVYATIVHRPLQAAGYAKINSNKYSYDATSVAGPIIIPGKASLISFSLVSTSTPATGNIGGGLCSNAVGGAARPLAIKSDPQNILTITGGNTANINVTVAMTFNCIYTAQCYNCGTFDVYLKYNGAINSQRSGTTTTSNPNSINGTTGLQVTAPFTLQMFQRCDSSPDTYTLGLPVAPYTNPNDYAIISCSTLL